MRGSTGECDAAIPAGHERAKVVWLLTAVAITAAAQLALGWLISVEFFSKTAPTGGYPQKLATSAEGLARPQNNTSTPKAMPASGCQFVFRSQRTNGPA
jgi:hypothetical protein